MKGLCSGPAGSISAGPTRWPPGDESHLVPKTPNLKPQTTREEMQTASFAH